MGRPISTTLQEILDEVEPESQSTLELRLENTEIYWYSTGEVVIDGVTYQDDLQKTGEIIQSAFSNVDRTTSQIQNVDKQIGLQILSGDIDKAQAVVGRFYRSGIDPTKTAWAELFRGEAKPTEITPTNASIEILDDLVAAGYCVADENYAPDCPLVYAEVPRCGADPALPPCSHNLETCRVLHHFAGMETKIESVSTVPGDGGGGGGIGGDGGDGSGGGRCFVGETEVVFPNNELIKLADIYHNRAAFIGCYVKAFDSENNIVTGKILDVFKSRVFRLLEVKFKNEATPMRMVKEHRFRTENKEFVSMYLLTEGEKIFAHENDWELAEIESMRIVQVPEGVDVFNLLIEKYHVYFACSKGAKPKAVSNSKPIDYYLV